MNSEIISDIKLRAQRKTIHELRQIARAVGVVRPADGKKERLIEDIVKIAMCEIPPAPRSSRGAPPKSTMYDEQLVADIEECINYYSALKNGANPAEDAVVVSDGTGQSPCVGILQCEDKNFFLRVNGCFPSREDVLVHESFVARFGLKEGDLIEGIKTRKSAEEGAALTSLISVNGFQPEILRRIAFENLTSIYPETRIRIAYSADDTAARMIDLFAPVGFGQRGIICAPSNSGKTTLLKQIVWAIARNHPELKIVIFLAAERPEDIHYLRKTLNCAEIYATSFTNSPVEISEAAEFVTAYCKRQVECASNVVLIADGLTKLERASAEAGKPGAAKRFLSSAICAEEGGSLTVLATTSAEDGDLKRDLLQIANMRAELSETYALQGIYPAIDILKTYTSRCNLLQSEEEIGAASVLRKRLMEGASPSEITEIFKRTENNLQIIRELTDG